MGSSKEGRKWKRKISYSTVNLFDLTCSCVIEYYTRARLRRKTNKGKGWKFAPLFFSISSLAQGRKGEGKDLPSWKSAMMDENISLKGEKTENGKERGNWEEVRCLFACLLACSLGTLDGVLHERNQKINWKSHEIANEPFFFFFIGLFLIFTEDNASLNRPIIPFCWMTQ